MIKSLLIVCFCIIVTNTAGCTSEPQHPDAAQDQELSSRDYVAAGMFDGNNGAWFVQQGFLDTGIVRNGVGRWTIRLATKQPFFAGKLIILATGVDDGFNSVTVQPDPPGLAPTDTLDIKTVTFTPSLSQIDNADVNFSIAVFQF
jgi:hypothetical protein